MDGGVGDESTYEGSDDNMIRTKMVTVMPMMLVMMLARMMVFMLALYNDDDDGDCENDDRN